MVSSEDLIAELRLAYEEQAKRKSPDPFEYDPDNFDAVFELISVDSYLAGLACRVLAGQSLDFSEVESIPMDELVHKRADAMYFSHSEHNFKIDSPEIKMYTLGLERLRKCLIKIYEIN